MVILLENSLQSETEPFEKCKCLNLFLTNIKSRTFCPVSLLCCLFTSQELVVPRVPARWHNKPPQ